MAWLAVNKDGTEVICKDEPRRWGFIDYRYAREYELRKMSETDLSFWEDQEILNMYDEISYIIELPRGSIKRLIGRELTWDDEPVEI